VLRRAFDLTGNPEVHLPGKSRNRKLEKYICTVSALPAVDRVKFAIISEFVESSARSLLYLLV
jgi:hypothetical protein